MKKLLVFLLVLTLTISGCSFLEKKEPEKTTPPKQAEKQPPKEEKKDYIVGLQTAPVQGTKEWADRYKPYEGVFAQKKGDYRLVLVSQGEKFAEGYKVSVDKVEKKNDKWVVTANIVQPAEENYAGGSVFPHEVVSIIDDGKPVEVVKTAESNSDMAVDVIEIPEGKNFAVSKNFIVFSPLEGEQISSPVKIRGKARVFEATFRVSMEDGHNVLADKSIMSDAGAPAWGKFEISQPFDKPTSPAGSIIFSYANMENGKMIEELVLPVKF